MTKGWTGDELDNMTDEQYRYVSESIRSVGNKDTRGRCLFVFLAIIVSPAALAATYLLLKGAQS